MNAATATVPLVGDEIKFTERQIKNFWRKVDKDGPTQPHMDTPCWVWTASIRGDGYGQINILGRIFGSHRMAWLLENGPIPRGEGYHGVCILHACDLKTCCNVHHMRLGTNRENVDDMMSKGRQAKGATSGPSKHPECMPRGENNGSAKFTADTIREVRYLYSTGRFSYATLGAKFGIGRAYMSNIINRKTWAHVQDDWI